MFKRFKVLGLLSLSLLTLVGCKSTESDNNTLSKEDIEMLDKVQYHTFQYFWEGAEPTSGLARERYHVDGVYPQDDANVVTSGGGGFGLMNILVGIERGYISRDQGIEKLDQIVSFLENADKFHGAYPHWWYGETGKVKAFSEYDDGGDLVETAFMAQGLLTVHQYLNPANATEKDLAARIDSLWKGIEWDFYTRGENVLYWHWSPEHEWAMNFPVRGYNECLVMYVLAAGSPTYGVSADVYHEGWAENGAISKPHEEEGIPLQLRYQSEKAGPMFWAHYSFLGLDPRGLKDQYADYFQEMTNYTLINRAYCIRNPKGYEGYGENSWGLTASYSVNGYDAHSPVESRDHGVITPTAALASIVYTPNESMDVMRHLYQNRHQYWGPFGFIDAYSDTEKWYPQVYLAIDQGPIGVMIENYRTGFLWDLFMSHPDVQNGLNKLGFESPHLKNK